MNNLTELNEARIEAKAAADRAHAMRTYAKTAGELVSTNAIYQTAMNNWHRAELEYRAELQNTSTMGLMALAGVPAPRT